MVEAPLYGGHPVAEASKALASDGQRIGVAVDAQHLQVRMCIEQQGRVAGTAECGVEYPAGWHRGEDLYDLAGHDGLVFERFTHCGSVSVGVVVPRASFG